MLLYTLCPYTYFYVLSGGITPFVVLSVALTTQAIVMTGSIWQKSVSVARINLNSKAIILAVGLFALIYLRPNTALYAGIIILFLLIYRVTTKFPLIFAKKRTIDILILLSFLFCAVQQMLATASYSEATFTAFLAEKGTFFGYPRIELRQNIFNLVLSNSFAERTKGIIYMASWKLIDCFSGFADIRDTHSAFLDNSLFPFFARLITGFVYMLPFTLLAASSCIINIGIIIRSNLILPLSASLVSLFPSLLGVAMSRYYFMFFPPFLVLVSLMLAKVSFSNNHHK